MLIFNQLKKDVNIIKPYLNMIKTEFCDLSLGVKYMWWDSYRIDYAIFNGTLILKESCKDYKDAFYYPVGEDVVGALSEIENYCKENNISPFFCCIDNATVVELIKRYPYSEIYNDRDWSDYIYDAESFKAFVGKKYSGQRNHINKFKKTYPNYKVKVITESDYDRIDGFLREFEGENEFYSWSAKEEESKVSEYIRNGFNLSAFGAYIEVDGKIVAISVGERVKNTLIVQIEKGLKEYEGVYPTMANEFAKLYAVDGITLINREEDCGDMGLRISKLQYHPVEIKEKNFVKVNTAFCKIPKDVKVETERLTLDCISYGDKTEYASLCLDDDLNRFYGYDYREDLKGEEPTADYFYNFQNSLKEKGEEFPLAIRLNGKLIGEFSLWHFDIYGGVEIGFRIKREYQGKGYVTESVLAIKKYLFNTVKVPKIKCRAYKENVKSQSVIARTGFTAVGEDDKYFYYESERTAGFNV